MERVRSGILKDAALDQFSRSRSTYSSACSECHKERPLPASANSGSLSGTRRAVSCNDLSHESISLSEFIRAASPDGTGTRNLLIENSKYAPYGIDCGHCQRFDK